MRLTWIVRSTVLFLLLTLSSTVLAFSTRTESWVEDALLHDGRIIKVSREVDWTFQFLGGDSGSPVFMESWPDKFWLKFTHPDTQKTIKWQGVQYFNPILLDIVDGVPYLVVLGRPTKDNEKIYGCPELPYIYLRYESGFFGKWLPIPVETAPQVLRNANLSPSYPPVSKAPIVVEVGKINNVEPEKPADEKPSEGSFQRKIPRSYDEWHYAYKNSYRNERRMGDCRPPLQPLPDIPLPKPVDIIALEAIGSQDFTVKNANEYYKLLTEKKGAATRANCAKFFRPPNPENLMLGERFVNDLTGNERLPYSGATPLPSGRMLETRTERYCDEKFVWFIAGHEEPGKTHITKYTASGDFLYNIRIADPKIADNKLARNMVLDSITAENGYFNFYWSQSLPMPSASSMVYPNRMTKFRFREPVNVQ